MNIYDLIETVETKQDFIKEKLINALIPLLIDSTKDWYANILLYQIVQKDATSLVVIENRNDWIRRNKETDLLFWENYHFNEN